HCSSVISSSGARGPWPALLTSTSMRPHCAMARSTSRLKSSVDWLEPVTPKPPSAFASASPLPEEERMATRKPSAASLRAAAAPIPLPPAVTSATFCVISRPPSFRRQAKPFQHRAGGEALHQHRERHHREGGG